MKSSTIKIVWGSLAVICLGFVFAVWWIFFDFPKETKLQSFQVGPNTTIDIYLESHFDTYGCVFEIRTNNRVAIPKEWFDGGTYFSAVVGGKESSWKDYTRYEALLSSKSKVVGVVSSQEPAVVMFIFNSATLELCNLNSWDLTSEQRTNSETLGEELLSKLQADFPNTELLLDKTEKARLARFKRNFPNGL